MKKILTTTLLGGLALMAIGVLVQIGFGGAPGRPDRPDLAVNIRPQDMADSLHAVIAADRDVYASTVVHRLQNEAKVIQASETWEKDKALPVPAQLLRLGAETVQSRGAEFSYTLRALRPLNPKNAPETEVEKEGLQKVAAHPESNFYIVEKLGGRRYFTAIYPEVASQACVACHNQHKNSPRTDHKPGDVLGGMVIRIALEL